MEGMRKGGSEEVKPEKGGDMSQQVKVLWVQTWQPDFVLP